MKKVWLFAVIVGASSLFSEYVHLYLDSQKAFLKRQYELEDGDTPLLSLPSPIATLFTILVLSVIARRVHIPRVLAVTSVIAGSLSLVCVVPYLVSKGDLTKMPTVEYENKTLTPEKIKFSLPSCLLSRYPADMLPKMIAIMSPSGPKPAATTTTTTTTTTTAWGPPSNSTTTDVPRETTTVFEGSGVTIPLLNMDRLSKHNVYPQLVPMAKMMGVDLKALETMTDAEQAEYLLKMPPQLQNKLPMLKALLGKDPEQYFTSYELPKNRTRRSTRLSQDYMYSGSLAKMMKGKPPLSPQTIRKMFDEMCFYNTEPFHGDDHSSMVLVLLVLAMILHGIAVAPRMAFVITFIEDNTEETDTALILGLFTAAANLGPFVSTLLSILSFSSYVTLEDTGYMSFLNPRWLPAWWVGFLILGVLALCFSVPLFFFPKNIKPRRKYSTKKDRKEPSCFQWVFYELKGLLPCLFRLMTNGVYILLLLGTTLSFMAWEGILVVIPNYVSSQFSLDPLQPGITLSLIQSIIVMCGTVMGGFVASKMKWTAVNCLKAAALLSCVIVVLHGANIGFGCGQPDVDKADRIVENVSTSDKCSETCVCIDMGYAPVCGSDGVSYYSACHAGCGDQHDGKFHDCKCIEDHVKTATLDLCPQTCNMFYAFCAAFLIGSLAFGLRVAPLLLSSYRCVDSKDIPAAIGLKFFYILLFGKLVAPHIYRTLESSSCTVDRPECGVFPSCALYDIADYRVKVFVTSFVLEVVGALLLLAAFFFGRKPTSKFNERVFDKDQTK